VSASAPDGSDLNNLQCVVLPVVNKVLTNMDVSDIRGLDSIGYESTPLPSHCVDVSAQSPANVEKSVDSSEHVPAGVVVGAALGGMCLVLLGLLAVRQGMIKNREDTGTVLKKETKALDFRALEVTVDANETQTTSKYLTPRTSSSNDSTVLGISASPDDCSEWGDGKGPSKIDDDDDDDDIETPRRIQSKPAPDPSDITFDDDHTVAPTVTCSPDPPTSEPQVMSFAPTVHEEENITHDVNLVPDGEDESTRGGIAEA